MPDAMDDLLKGRIDGARRAVEAVDTQLDAIGTAANAIVTRLAAGGTIYTCGNGGSAAEAMHLSEELVGRYRAGLRPAQAAVCLNADPAALTCIANDFGFEQVFARQCEALVGAGDVLVALSTSGNSANVVRALETARAVGAVTIGLLGGDGGDARASCDHAIVIPDADSAHVQEAHLVIVHLFCEVVEAAAR